MITEGWFKIHRRIFESLVFQDEALLKLAIYCIGRANHKESRWFIPGTKRSIRVPRGSFVTGQFQLHQDLYPKRKSSNPSTSTLWRNLHVLEELEFVSLSNLKNRATMVSVCNYETYQDTVETNCKTDEKPMKNRCQGSAKVLPTGEECKECKEVIQGLAPSTARSVFIPPTEEQVAAYCAERGNNVSPSKFIDHYEANGWMRGKTKLKDWRAAVRTWEGNDKKRATVPRLLTTQEEAEWTP